MTSARDLSTHLADLLRCERAALSEFLVALADFHRRRLWLELGHASLFYFLHRELGLSSGAAFYRKTAAELIEKFPEIIEPLRDGRLCLTSVVELAKVLTPENREDVLPRFFHLSKSGAKAVSAALRPDEAAPHRDVVTAVRAPVAAATLPLSGRAAVEPAPEPPFHLDEVPRANSRSEPLPPASPPRPGIEPLTAELSRLHVTVSREFLAKLEAARAALSHSHPGASAQDILEAGLDLLMERHDKRRGSRGEAAPRAARCEAGPRARAREAGGLEAGWRAVPVARDGGRRLRLHPPGRARPRRAARARWPADDRERPTAMPGSQSVRGSPDLRR